jgi:hypothetical protein
LGVPGGLVVVHECTLLVAIIDSGASDVLFEPPAAAGAQIGDLVGLALGLASVIVLPEFGGSFVVPVVGRVVVGVT